MHDAVEVRDAIVHGYQELDAGTLEDALANRLDDLPAFCGAVRARIDAG